MDAIVLAGGLGTRLRKTVPHCPKGLAPIKGTPFLDLLLKQLFNSQIIDRVILALGDRHDQIERYYEDSPFNLEYSIEDSPLGTGGAVKLASQLVKSPHYFVVNGDTIAPLSYQDMLDYHMTESADLTIAYGKTIDPSRYGGLLIDQGRIQAFHEKTGTSPFVSAGVYLFSQSISFPDKSVFSIEEDLFPSLTHKKMTGYFVQSEFIDIGTESSYTNAQEVLSCMF
ncbi:MAG: NTP transferase domain-containing protein [Simkaniaceae bacterium]|nr:NTP transferase domain-containing protein [Simkaniaceae bacterium]